MANTLDVGCSTTLFYHPIKWLQNTGAIGFQSNQMSTQKMNGVLSIN